MQRKKNTKLKDKEKSRAFSGLAVLTASVFTVKAIGALFKIPMIKYVGIESMGYFNAAYHFYSLLMTLSTAGLPVALSIIISRSIAENDFCRVKRDSRAAIKLFSFIGAILSLIMFAFSGRIASFLGIENTKYCLMAISPAVFLVSLSGGVRGYFQGHGIMAPTAISQVIEAFGKLFFGLALALFAMNLGKPPHITAAYAIFGITVGLFASVIYLLISKTVHERNLPALNECKNDFKIYKKLFKTALPITIGSAVLSLTSLIDTLVIPKTLIRSGLEAQTALNIYSTYTNLALPIFAFPTAFITPISLVLIPSISSASVSRRSREREKIISSSLRICAFMILPCALGIGVFSKQILSLIFPFASEEVIIGARLLSILSCSIFFSALMSVTNAILQACGREKEPIISLAAGAAAKLASEYFLISSEKININGAPISTFICSLTVVAMNFFFICRACEKSFSPFALFIRPLASSALSLFLAIAFYALASGTFKTPLSLALTVALTASLYFPLSLKLGSLDKEDILPLPQGEKIAKVLFRLKLLK